MEGSKANGSRWSDRFRSWLPWAAEREAAEREAAGEGGRRVVRGVMERFELAEVDGEPGGVLEVHDYRDWSATAREERPEGIVGEMGRAVLVRRGGG